MKCDQDLCLNLWYDLKKLLWYDELNPRVRCAFGNVFFQKIPLNGKKVVFDSFAKNRFVYKGLSLKDCLASKCSLKNEALSINWKRSTSSSCKSLSIPVSQSICSNHSPTASWRGNIVDTSVDKTADPTASNIAAGDHTARQRAWGARIVETHSWRWNTKLESHLGKTYSKMRIRCNFSGNTKLTMLT